MQCDRRQSEITALVLQIAEAAASSGENPEIVALLAKIIAQICANSCLIG